MNAGVWHPIKAARVPHLQTVCGDVERRGPKGIAENGVGAKHFLDGSRFVVCEGQFLQDLLDGLNGFVKLSGSFSVRRILNIFANFSVATLGAPGSN
jgi:hypothetical protein